MSSHTSLTAIYAQDENIKAAGDYRLEEQMKGSVEAALGFQQGARSAFEQRRGMSMFEYYKKFPEKGARFASAIKGIRKCTSFQKYRVMKED